MTPADIFDGAREAEIAHYWLHPLNEPDLEFDYLVDRSPNKRGPWSNVFQGSFDAANRFIRDRGFEAGMRALAEKADNFSPHNRAVLLKLIE